MFYHAILSLSYGPAKHYWWNMSRDHVITDLLTPFVNGQIVYVNYQNGHALLNMKDANLG